MLKDMTLSQEMLDGIPSEVIGPYQFFLFHVLNTVTSLTLPSHIKYICDSAFKSLNALGKTLICNQNLEIIDKNAFENYNLSFKNIILNNGLKVIGNSAFLSNRAMDNNFIIPDSVEFIGNEAFKNCNKIPSVKWSSNCPVVPYFCFNGCSAISSVTNLDNVHVIGASAFTGTAITELFLPNINGIHQNGIYDCKSLTTITFGPELGYTAYQWIRYCTSLTTINVIGDENCITAQTLQATSQDFLNNATIVYNYTPPESE